MDSELATISGIVGFAMPAAIAVLNRERWKPATKAIAAFVLCLVAALLTAWYQDALNAEDVRATALIVVGSAIGSYQLWWKPSTLTDRIESATG